MTGWFSSRLARATRVLALAAVAAVAASCGDTTRPTSAVGPAGAGRSLQFTDWYSCSRLVSETEWHCSFTGTTSIDLASWADFPSAPIYSSLQEVKVTNSTCPQCPTEPGVTEGPRAYVPKADTGDKTQLFRPNCRLAQPDERTEAWCKANAVLLPGRRARILEALQRMAALGGECASLAALGQSLLANGAIRVFESNGGLRYSGGGFAPMGAGPDGYILLRSSWTDLFYLPGTGQATSSKNGVPYTVNRNLQQVLAHELDHLNGRDHVDAMTYSTPNSDACGS